MNVGRNPDGLGALMVITTSDTVPAAVAERLRGADGVTEVYLVELGAFGDEG